MQKTSIRKRLSSAIRDSLRFKRSKLRVRRLLKAQDEIWLELGAGDKKGSHGWTTLDVCGNCDLYWDLRKGIPFPDSSITRLYSSHFFEHLSYKEIQIFLDECLRVLKPGGSFSICVPNASLYVEAYMNGTMAHQDFDGYRPAWHHTTRIDFLNYIAYMDGLHKHMFDEENLLFILRAKGFQHVQLRPFDPTIDLKERDFESIYAEARKEAA